MTTTPNRRRSTARKPRDAEPSMPASLPASGEGVEATAAEALASTPASLAPLDVDGALNDVFQALMAEEEDELPASGASLDSPSTPSTPPTRRAAAAKKPAAKSARASKTAAPAASDEASPEAAPAEAKPARKRAGRARAVDAVIAEAAEAAQAIDASPEADADRARAFAPTEWMETIPAAALDVAETEAVASTPAAESAEAVPTPARKRGSRKRGAAAEAVAELMEPELDSAGAPDVVQAGTDAAMSAESDSSADDEVSAPAAKRGRRSRKSRDAADAKGAADEAAEVGVEIESEIEAQVAAEVDDEPPAPPRYTLGSREDDSVFGDYELHHIETGATVRLRLLGPDAWRCDCADYAAHAECEHGEALVSLLDRTQLRTLVAGWPAREAEVWLVPGAQRRLQWVPGRDLPPALRDRAGVDEAGRIDAEFAHDWLQQLMSEARAHGVVLRVDAPVWPQLAWCRDAQARVRRLERLMADGPAMAALLRDELPVYQWEAALFAVCAGRALLSDDLGLGQRGAAVAAVRLWRELLGVGPVLLVAPASSHDAWRRDFQRWLGEVPAGLTLAAPTTGAAPVTKQPPSLLIVDGVETLSAEELAALRSLSVPHLLLIAAQEPLSDDRLGEWVDWLDPARRGPFAQWQALPVDAGKRARREALEAVVLSRRKRELLEELPTALLTPLSLEAAGSSLPQAPLKQLRQQIERWTATHFLGSADQQQLLEALALLPPASRQALAAKAEAVLQLRRDWLQSAVPAATRLLLCARSETLLDSLAQSPQLRRLPTHRLRAGDAPSARDATLQAWRQSEAGVLLASDDALAHLPEDSLTEDRLAVVHADLPWRAEVLTERVERAAGEDAVGVPSALLLIEGSLDAAVLRAHQAGVQFPAWLDAAPVWLEVDQLESLMAVLPGLIDGL